MGTWSTSAQIKLARLAGKQSAWSSLSPKDKIPYLQNAKDAIGKLSLKGLSEMLGEKCADMKQVTGKERELVVAEETLLMASFAGYIDALLLSYQVVAGTSPPEAKEELMKYQKRQVGNQVVADVFPLLTEDKEGPIKEFKGELWFQKDAIQKTEDVQAFQLEALDEKKQGVLVILGAGNYTGLTLGDVLHGLFVRNQVCFCKLHPLRPYLEDFLRVILAPLYQDGFFDSEVDSSVERTKEFIYDENVTGVHMTGGKATHDLIVWGSTPEEQATNKANQTPILQSEMTSELGAASPYIMTPALYTPEELAHQAKTLIGGKWCNGSASCNAPQVVVMGSKWAQRDQFISLLEDSWTQAPQIATYYPGASQRWKAFQSKYPDSKIVHSREQSAGKIEESHLPLLVVNVSVNLSTPEGRAQAKKEYALQNEAFTPVLVLATVHEDTGDMKDFMPTAVTLSNDYLYGSLSCSMAVPTSAEGSAPVEDAVASLQYGMIALNAWAAQGYLTRGLSWGGFHGETLDKVESGIGLVCNSMFFPSIEKAVLRTPCVHGFHFDFCKSSDEIIGFYNFVAGALLGIAPSQPTEEKKEGEA